MSSTANLVQCAPPDVRAMSANREIVLIDVREPQEYAVERIPGALLMPLSTFDPAALPDPGGRRIVFHCGSGKRSATAVDLCLRAGIAHDTHMAGGLMAWKMHGLPTLRLDPATGQFVQI